MEPDRDLAWAAFIAKHREGEVVCGLTTRVEIKDRYVGRAFVTVEGIEATIDAQDVNWGRQACLPQAGNEVYCLILRIDTQSRKVELGQAIWNWKEWQGAEQRYPNGSRHRLRVTDVIPEVAWVAFERGIDGLLWAEDMPQELQATPLDEFLSAGQEIDIVVLPGPHGIGQLRVGWATNPSQTESPRGGAG